MSRERDDHRGESTAGFKLEDQSEGQLIELGLSGDARALDALFARNTRALYQTALRVLGNPEDAEEIRSGDKPQFQALTDMKSAWGGLPAARPRSLRFGEIPALQNGLR